MCTQVRLPALLPSHIQWLQVINGPHDRPPRQLYGILLAIVTLIGIFDGSCVGAVYGECAVLGPNAVHVSEVPCVTV
jgi:hypothetical protein